MTCLFSRKKNLHATSECCHLAVDLRTVAAKAAAAPTNSLPSGGGLEKLTRDSRAHEGLSSGGGYGELTGIHAKD